MKIQKNLFILIFCLTFFLSNQTANAFIISDATDMTINFAAKTTYLTTKYSLKTVIFIVKKTAKAVKVISKGVYSASKDAFASPSTPKANIYPINNSRSFNNNLPKVPINSLPPAPSFNSLPPVPDDSLPIIKY